MESSLPRPGTFRGHQHNPRVQASEGSLRRSNQMRFFTTRRWQHRETRSILNTPEFLGAAAFAFQFVIICLPGVDPYHLRRDTGSDSNELVVFPRNHGENQQDLGKNEQYGRQNNKRNIFSLPCLGSLRPTPNQLAHPSPPLMTQVTRCESGTNKLCNKMSCRNAC